jgi:DNA primase
VAPLGTALTESQLELLWRVTPQPVLCFDGDSAGLRAASRAADLALPFLKPGRSASFALLPDGKDPDDIVKQEGRAPFDRLVAEARPLAQMIWERETGGANFDTPEKRAELDSRLKQIVSVIADESVRYHYQQDIRNRLHSFFSPATAGGGGDRRQAFQRGRGGQQGKRGGAAQNYIAGGAAVESGTAGSAKLNQMLKLSGHTRSPALRETVLALTIVNHPQLLLDEYDEISSVDFEHKDLQRFWSCLLAIVGRLGAKLSAEGLRSDLSAEGFADLLEAMNRQVRNARLWTATEEADAQDALQAYRQTRALHSRNKELRWQKIELEKEIADLPEDEAERGDLLLRALLEIQNEITRLENQEAIIDGFGVLSGRVKGAAVGH